MPELLPELEVEPEPEEPEQLPDELPPDELDPEPEELVPPDELEPELEPPPELELASKAPQKVEVPPLLALHCQVHGPVPLTADAVPEEQRLPVGALATLWPLDEPHMPLTTITPPPEFDPEPEELEPPDETPPDEPEPEPEEPVLPDELLPDELESEPEELVLPDELEPEPEELVLPDDPLPDELEPELELLPSSGRTQRGLPLPHRFVATRVSLLCRLRLLTGIVPRRVTTDHTPLVSV